MKRFRSLPLLALACLLGASSMALAAPIPVNNASFERPMLDSGGWSNDLPDPDLVDGGPDWIGQNGANDGNTFIEFIPGFNSEGNQHLGMQGNYYVFQNTGVAWKANTGYSLTVGVGNRGETAGALTLIGLTSSTESPGPDNTLSYQNANEFLDDPLYISGAGMTIDSGSNDALSFTDYTVSFITGAEPPPGNVVIFLGDEGTAQRSHFDNVRLNANTGPSLIAHFPLDENGNSETFGGFVAATVDDSVTFGTAGANGNTGTSATFDGSGIVQHEWSADLNPESFTLALWAKSEGGAGAWNSPVTSRDEQNGGPQKGYLIYDDEPGGVWTFWSGSNLGGWQILNGPAVKVGEWQHLAISYDNETQTKSLYVDGELVGEQNEPVAPAETTPFSIGGGGDFGADFRFIGDIDDIGLWNYVLSEQELLTAMTQGVLATQPEALAIPVAHFALDEDGNSPEAGGFVASTVDNVTFGAPGANANTGGAATFDGSGLIQHDWSADLNPESFTLTLWAKSDGGAGAWNSPVTSRHDLNPDSQGYLIYDNEPGGVWTFWSGNGTVDGNWQVLDGPDVTLGEWEHIAISYDKATETKKLYVNGELAVEANDAVFPNDTTPFNIGGGGDFGADFRFIGDIDDIGLWDVVLSDNDILLAMESGVKAFFGEGGGVNPLDPDGDGIFTPLEEKHGLDPNVADADSDKDGDGVIASVEIFELGTLANNPDTDGDGLSDGVETNTGTYVDATNTGTNPTSDDTDDDGLKDGAEVPDSDPPGTSPLAADTDGDGFDDGKELLAGTDPLDANSKPDFPVVIGYWPFDDQGSTETADLGPAGITSLVNGDPEWVPGHSGNANDFAIKFDGEDDSVTTDVSLLNDLAELTMSFWIRMEEEQLGNRIGLVGQNDAVEYGMINPTTMQWWSPAGSVDVEFGPIVEEWTHVAVVLNSEGFKVFSNGEIIGESAGGGPVTSGDTLNIGGDGVFDADGNFFLGEIDDVAIWDTALSDAQIADLANQVICPLGACGGSDFNVREISRADDGMVNLTWDSSPGRFYDIEASPDLSPGSWVPMGVAIPAEGGEALVTSASVEGDVAQLMEYFRVGRVDPPPFLETSFEDGLGEWTTTSVAGSMWEAGVPTAGPPAAKTGANVAGTGLAGDYEDGTVGSLRTPVIDTLGNRVSLSFSYFLEAVEGEGGRVNLLEADGSLIQNFEPIYTGGEDGNTADWTDVSFRLPNSDPARPFIIEFEFLTGDDGDPNNGAGWFIDDVSIGK
ncbi:hypothetical protein OAV21_02645 [bacterium]|nr:hypothetical protein [Verrucomicrobiales bacterium]MDC3255274.1 hypothetical protein [bacterium]MDF1785462.1 hypothetical protein [Verrucomicrobiales bacterium]